MPRAAQLEVPTTTAENYVEGAIQLHGNLHVRTPSGGWEVVGMRRGERVVVVNSEHERLRQTGVVHSDEAPMGLMVTMDADGELMAYKYTSVQPEAAAPVTAAPPAASTEDVIRSIASFVGLDYNAAAALLQAADGYVSTAIDLYLDAMEMQDAAEQDTSCAGTPGAGKAARGPAGDVAQLREENSRLRRELAVANAEFDRQRTESESTIQQLTARVAHLEGQLEQARDPDRANVAGRGGGLAPREGSLQPTPKTIEVFLQRRRKLRDLFNEGTPQGTNTNRSTRNPAYDA